MTPLLREVGVIAGINEKESSFLPRDFLYQLIVFLPNKIDRLLGRKTRKKNFVHLCQMGATYVTSFSSWNKLYIPPLPPFLPQQGTYAGYE